jgi:hypothetical protein
MKGLKLIANAKLYRKIYEQAILTVQTNEVPYFEDEEFLRRLSGARIIILIVAKREEELVSHHVVDILIEEQHALVDLELALDLHLLHEEEVLVSVDKRLVRILLSIHTHEQKEII